MNKILDAVQKFISLEELKTLLNSKVFKMSSLDQAMTVLALKRAFKKDFKELKEFSETHKVELKEFLIGFYDRHAENGVAAFILKVVTGLKNPNSTIYQELIDCFPVGFSAEDLKLSANAFTLFVNKLGFLANLSIEELTELFNLENIDSETADLIQGVLGTSIDTPTVEVAVLEEAPVAAVAAIETSIEQPVVKKVVLDYRQPVD